MAYIAGMPAGRPLGSKDSYKRTRRPREIVLENKRVGMSPIEYLVDLVNDESASKSRRDRAAIAAVRYLRRVAGKKAPPEAPAHAIPADTHWRSGLRPTPEITPEPWEENLRLPDLDWDRLLNAPLPPADTLALPEDQDDE
jgi:hypothetical protein